MGCTVAWGHWGVRDGRGPPCCPVTHPLLADGAWGPCVTTLSWDVGPFSEDLVLSAWPSRGDRDPVSQGTVGL